MNIGSLRIQKGWTQDELAEMSGISVRTIQRIEKGEKLSISTRKKLATALDIDGKLLIGESKAGVAENPQSNVKTDKKNTLSTASNFALLAGLTISTIILFSNQSSLERAFNNISARMTHFSEKLAVIEIFNFRNQSQLDELEENLIAHMDRVSNNEESTESNPSNITLDTHTSTTNDDAEVPTSETETTELLEQRANYLTGQSAPADESEVSSNPRIKRSVSNSDPVKRRNTAVNYVESTYGEFLGGLGRSEEQLQQVKDVMIGYMENVLFSVSEGQAADLDFADALIYLLTDEEITSFKELREERAEQTRLLVNRVNYRRLDGVSEANKELFLDTMALELVTTQERGKEARVQALINARNKVSDDFTSEELEIVNNYIKEEERRYAIVPASIVN